MTMKTGFALSVASRAALVDRGASKRVDRELESNELRAR